VAAHRIIDNAEGANISERLKTEWIQASRHQTALALNDRTARKRAGANAAYQAPAPQKSRTVAKKKGATTTVVAKKGALRGSFFRRGGPPRLFKATRGRLYAPALSRDLTALYDFSYDFSYDFLRATRGLLTRATQGRAKD
jgi:hypothetical protein